MSRRIVVALVAACALALTGCSAATAVKPTPTATTAALTGTVVVDAASSLTAIFQTLGDDFEKANPGVTVTFNFGGSDALAAQIVSGAPVDVFAAASPATMKTVTDAKDTSKTPTIFVTNSLEIAVPPSNPGKITGLKDFTDASKTIAICAPTVPCGAAAVQVFTAAGLTAAPDTLEQDVASVLTKVELGEVDAGLVYRTDVQGAGSKVKGIAFPEADKAINQYPIAPLKASTNPDAAAAFVAYILSSHGRSVLSAAGFELP